MTVVNSSGADLGSLLDMGPWTRYQKAVVALTASAVVFDGLDIQIMGYAIPAVSQSWGLAKSAFASVLAAGLCGVTIGSALGGIAGDRIGRRPALILNVFFFALATLGMAATNSLTALLILRFCAGLGIGGALPNAATLTAEYTPIDRRPFATTLTIICIPLGGVLAGLLASSLLPAHSWRTLFLAAGLLPLLHALFLLAFLPESPRFLAQDPANASRLKKVIESIQGPTTSSHALIFSNKSSVSASASPRALFVGGQARNTFALWGAFFFCLLTVYLAFNWLPSILLAHHFTSKQATQGLTLYNFGGIVGAVAVGWWISLRGSRFPMSLCAALAIVSALMTAWLIHSQTNPHPVLLYIIGFHGLAVNAVQTTLYALATHLYATSIRSTGVAFALAVGRIGAIVSAYLGAGLLSLHTYNYFLVLASTMCMVFITIQLVQTHIVSPAPTTHSPALPKIHRS
jgi:AAHS family 4-hydroxybenzoate transporter-like MFS transporter